MDLKEISNESMICVRTYFLQSRDQSLFMSTIASLNRSGRSWACTNHTPQIWPCGRKKGGEIKVISYLTALGSQYESAKTQILISMELPTLNATFSRLSRISMADEQVLDNQDNTAMTATARSITSSPRGRGRICPKEVWQVLQFLLEIRAI